MIRTRLAVAAQGLAALVVAAAIVAGVPAALWRLTGAPLMSPPSGGWSGWTADVSDDALVWMLAQVCWIAWALFTASLLAEAVATATHRLAPTLPVPRSVRRLAAQLVASVVLLGTLIPAPPRPQQTMAFASTAIPDSAPETPEASPEDAAPPAYAEHIVQRREDLWSIATDHLGDPYRWRDIWDLNQGRQMPDGQRFTNPDHIRPGWTLQLPIPAAPASPPETADAPPNAHEPAPACKGTDPNAPPHIDQDVDDPAEAPPGPDAPVRLPGGGLVTIGFAAGLSTALALARLHERRRYNAHQPGSDGAGGEPLANRPAIRPLIQAAYAHGPANPHEDGYPPPQARLWSKGVSLHADEPDEVARGLLLEALMQEPDRTTMVLIGDRLLPERVMPGATWHTTLDSALTALEVELIRRTRTLDEVNVRDIAALRAAHPQEPAGLVVLAAPAPDRPAPRLDTVLELGARLGIRGLFLGRYDHPALLPVVASDPLLPRLTQAQAGDILHALAARNGQPGQPPVDRSEPMPAAPTQLAQHPRIYVRLFGPLRASVNGRELAEATRPKALELLAYLLVHPQGASRDAIAESLWPAEPPQPGFRKLGTVVTRLRETLRTATGMDEAEFVQLRPTGHYQLDASLIDCDLWGYDRSLRAARDDAENEPDHLNRALLLHDGELLDGSYYNWVDPIRESVRRRALDAATRLADLHTAAGNPQGASQALERAIEIDPYAESVYRRLMQIHAAEGHDEAVLAIYRRLEGRLSELDVDPSPETTAVTRALHSRAP